MEKEAIKEYIIKCIRSYANEHKYQLETDASDNSQYFFIKINETVDCKIRLSNHDTKNYCCSLNIRYDKFGKNAKPDSIKRSVYSSITKAILRDQKYHFNKLLNSINKD